MILDNLLMFTNTSAGGTNPGDLLGAAGTAASTNNIDLHILAPPGVPVLAAGQGARDWGIGDDPALKLMVTMGSPGVGGTSLQVSLAGAPDNGSGLPAAFVVWYSSPVYTVAQLVQGARLLDMDVPRPPDGQPIPRFLQLQFTTAGTFTGGAIKAGIVLDRWDLAYNSTNNAIPGGYPPGVVVPN